MSEPSTTALKAARLANGIAGAALSDALTENAKLRAEVERLQRIIDSRPAINAGLPGTYIEWSQSIYAMEFARAQGVQPS